MIKRIVESEEFRVATIFLGITLVCAGIYVT
jgi:hypothetical protein